MLKGNLLVGQSGGSTSVINGSLAGVMDEAAKHDCVRGIYGMRFGIEGFMEEKIVDLREQPPGTTEALRRTPGSALGSSRHKLRDQDLAPILALLKKYDIRRLLLIGGNDTMDTIHRLEAYARENGWEMHGVGVPKTVDNDLFGTDHTPGFATAARNVAISVMQSGIIARDMERVDPILVQQFIGRDAGWLSAAAALARRQEGDAPHLIYLPEVPFSWERFRADVRRVYKKYGWVSIVNGEGVADENGKPVSYGTAAEVRDKFGNVEFGSTGGVSAARELFLAATKELGLRGEYQQPESLPLCGADRPAPYDAAEAYESGRQAVRLTIEGRGGVMVTIVRESSTPYRAGFGTIPLKEVAIKNRRMPREMINVEGNDVTQAFLDYARPLVGDLPQYGRLTLNFVPQ
jgi:6-phosphofructokinase 1